MENVVMFYGHLEYITANWYIIGPFCNLAVSWYIFPRFGILYHEKSDRNFRQSFFFFKKHQV
jgi:hypothetical protein